MQLVSKVRPLAIGLGLVGVVLALAQCNSTGGSASESMSSDARREKSLAAWSVVYRAIQSPRCVNCHPSGDVPLQGEDGHPHTQNVQRGADGRGLYGMRCTACHQTQNVEGLHLPPGSPDWRLPRADAPLVFEGRSSGELCRQLLDRTKNGGRTVEQLREHLTTDPLVEWGWNPGQGRAPVPISRPAFVEAVRTWIDDGCACPEH